MRHEDMGKEIDDKIERTTREALQKTSTISFKCVKLTTKTLTKAISEAFGKEHDGLSKKNEVSLEKLSKGGELEEVAFDSKEKMKHFKKHANKFGVKYAVKVTKAKDPKTGEKIKDPKTGKDMLEVKIYMKSAQHININLACESYLKEMEKREKYVPIKTRLKNLKNEVDIAINESKERKKEKVKTNDLNL